MSPQAPIVPGDIKDFAIRAPYFMMKTANTNLSFRYREDGLKRKEFNGEQ